MAGCVFGIFAGLLLALVTAKSTLYISNLDTNCMQCLCEAATACNITFGCREGYCGPFFISKIYWTDAGKHVLENDDVMRPNAYQDCAFDYPCASQIVMNYMKKYGRDCNDDGVTNCDDYALIHKNGGWRCDGDISKTPYHGKYLTCRDNIN